MQQANAPLICNMCVWGVQAVCSETYHAQVRIASATKMGRAEGV